MASILPSAPPPLQRRDSATSLVLAIIAWCVVAFIAILLPVSNELSKQSVPAGEGIDPAFQMQGQYTLGAARALDEQKQTFLDQFAEGAKGEQQRQAAEIVREVANDPTVAIASEAYDLGPHFPWYNRLADLATRDSAIAKADQVFARVIVLAVTGLGLGALALAMGILAIILLATGKIRLPGVRPTAPAGLYIEAFALWLLIYLAGSIVLEVVLRGGGSMGVRLIPLGFAFVVALAAPVLRGARWSTVRHDIGLHMGRGLLTEIGAGIAGYLACVPIILASIGVVLVLQQFADQQASHPIQEMLTTVNPIWLYLLAAVFAPVTEEVVFRGLLLTHLRGKLGIWLSGIISGLIFAAIHPQGWIAIPSLMTIAFVLALIREWRHSLIAPIIAHGINNAAVVTIMVLLMR